MSDTIFIWNPAAHGSVTSAAQAGNRIDALTDSRETSPDPAILGFIQALLREFPLAEQGPDQDSVWQTDELSCYGDSCAAAFGFSLPETSTLEVMAAILRHASAAGIAVFDPQRDWVWLPDGKAYPQQARDAASVMDTVRAPRGKRPPGWSHWAKLMHRELGPILEEAGFTDSSIYPLKESTTAGEYSRVMQDGIQKLHFDIAKIRNSAHPDDERYGMDIAILHELDPLDSTFKTFWKRGFKAAVAPISFWFFSDDTNKPKRARDAWICIEEESGRARVRDLLRNKILPFMNATSTVCGLNRMINEEAHPMAKHLQSSLARIVLAKICGSTRLDALHERYASIVRDRDLLAEDVIIIETIPQRYHCSDGASSG